jgi:hypothetical protein
MLHRFRVPHFDPLPFFFSKGRGWDGRKNDDHVFDKIFGQIIHTAFSRDIAYRVPAIIGLYFPRRSSILRWRLD